MESVLAMSDKNPVFKRRQDLIRENLSLVKMVASKMARRLPPHIELDDLISAGTVGLIDAVDKFDSSRAQNFRKYAEIRINGAILDELRALDHVTRTVRRQAAVLGRAVKEVQAEIGGKASAEQVAEHLGVNLEEYHALVHKLKPVYLVSLEQFGGDSDGERRGPMEIIGDPQAIDPQMALHFKMLRDLVAETIESLNERQRLVVSLYYYDDMTLKEIGKVLGVTESRISQMLTQAVETLKKRIRLHLASELAGVPLLD